MADNTYQVSLQSCGVSAWVNPCLGKHAVPLRTSCVATNLTVRCSLFAAQVCQDRDSPPERSGRDVLFVYKLVGR